MATSKRNWIMRKTRSKWRFLFSSIIDLLKFDYFPQRTSFVHHASDVSKYERVHWLDNDPNRPFLTPKRMGSDGTARFRRSHRTSRDFDYLHGWIAPVEWRADSTRERRSFRERHHELREENASHSDRCKHQATYRKSLNGSLKSAYRLGNFQCEINVIACFEVAYWFIRK